MNWAKGYFATLAVGSLVVWPMHLHGDAADFAAAGVVFAGFLVGFWAEHGTPWPRLRKREPEDGRKP